MNENKIRVVVIRKIIKGGGLNAASASENRLFFQQFGRLHIAARPKLFSPLVYARPVLLRMVSVPPDSAAPGFNLVPCHSAFFTVDIRQERVADGQADVLYLIWNYVPRWV